MVASSLEVFSAMDIPGSCEEASLIVLGFRPNCDFGVEDLDRFLTVKDVIEPELTEMVVPAI